MNNIPTQSSLFDNTEEKTSSAHSDLEAKVILHYPHPGVGELILNYAEKYNAFDDQIIGLMLEKLAQAEQNPELDMLILRSKGKHFSSGADLNWMKRMASNSHQENLDDANQLARLMQTLNDFSKPTLALVQGAAFGGAVGLAACCDIVIATQKTRFCLSEVKIGLVPAVISPYVVRAIGERQARRYFLTAEIISATQALNFGLVHELVEDDSQLDIAAKLFIQQLNQNSPQAMSVAKALIAGVANKPIDDKLIDYTSHCIADIRISNEGQEGLDAFLNKRQASWIKPVQDNDKEQKDV
ncbi:putative enoyl-CoA hydratase/isomerase [Marinomonas sp. MED121]|uniref:enoyl-CoA hydratase-related protein n=1 Tax=Marinomonas sp. MED121 TaxID=314277 RepID=UPI0000690B27|nr:enoyl-CoA hydratase-related protein [Marinomonas sp. MED121]EAQ66116.1 putative enoyl-CoA hydratase/isomerase [Marinomonas sp. MED121]